MSVEIMFKIMALGLPVIIMTLAAIGFWKGDL